MYYKSTFISMYPQPTSYLVVSISLLNKKNMCKPQFWAPGNNAMYKLLLFLFIALFLPSFIQQTCFGLLL